jgi:hypothetical protein
MVEVRYAGFVGWLMMVHDRGWSERALIYRVLQ